MVKVGELKGIKSLKALNAFHGLLLGLKMLPKYLPLSYEEFHSAVADLTDSEKEKMLREAACFVELQKEEVEALITFCYDSNGVPYGPQNLNNLGPSELVDIIVAVCMKIASIKIDLVSEDEKKN